MIIFYKVGVNVEPSIVVTNLLQYLVSINDIPKVKEYVTLFMDLSKSWYPNNTYLFITLEKRSGITSPNINERIDISWGRPEDYDWLINEDKSEYMGELI